MVERTPPPEAIQGLPTKTSINSIQVSRHIIYRSKLGLKLIKALEGDIVCGSEIELVTTHDKNDRVENVCCSENGEVLAWCDQKVIKCIKLDDTRETIFNQENGTKCNFLCFSPKATKLVTYSTMTGGDNLYIWDMSSKSLLLAMRYKRVSSWKPVFSMNEDLCIQHVNNELHIYPGCRFDKPKKYSHIKVDGFSLSTASTYDDNQNQYQHIYDKRLKNRTHHIAILTYGSKGQPSIVKIYKYPDMNECIANKSFFKADRVKFSWSPSGNSLLLVCQADFDKTGKSYYGQQYLNFMNVKGDSYFVKLDKEGPIQHIEWYPSCEKDMFICIFGQVPSVVALLNHKCEIVHRFEHEGLFNLATFSPFGNRLAIYGIGNLAGAICIWDFDKKKLISHMKVPETTFLDWCSDGIHLLTATVAPRLRVGNGYRLWHLSGSLIHEEICPDNSVEIYDIFWQPLPKKFRPPKSESKVSQLPNLIQKSNLSKFQGQSGKYVPPSMRNMTNKDGPTKNFDSAIGISGNRLIVGLESLQLDKKKKGSKTLPKPIQ